MINIYQPCLGKEELDSISKVFDSNWIGKGPKVEEFESLFAVAHNLPSDHFLSTTCATEGLFLAPVLFGCRDYEIIIPSISFVATANAAIAAGADVVLCDCDPITLNVRAIDIEKKITHKTKMVIVTHYGGFPCEMDDILDLCHSKGIFVVEDSACSILSNRWNGYSGTLADMGIWSFDAMKLLVCGDGGMMYFRNKTMRDIAKDYLYLGVTGKSKSGFESKNNDRWWEYDTVVPGRRAIMNDISAAIGIEQLKKLPSFLARRKEIALRYRKELGSLDGIVLPPERIGSNYMFWIQTEYRNELASYLKTKGIYTTFRYWPLHMTSLHRDNGPFPNTNYAASNTINIPLHQSLKEDEVGYIIESIKSFKA